MGLDMFLQTVPKKKIPKDYEDYCNLSNEYWNKGKKYERTLIDWRKANQIHRWFCDNCKCLEPEVLYLVTAEDISKLCMTIEQVLKNHAKAKVLLPTCSGFFYGSLEYDDWYFEELEYTLKELKTVLMDIEDNDLLHKKALIYYASW